MSEPATANCPTCKALIHWATLAATGKRVAVEPMREARLLSFTRDEPYRNVQEVRALVPHRCRRGNARA